MSAASLLDRAIYSYSDVNRRFVADGDQPLTSGSYGAGGRLDWSPYVT